MPTLLVQLDDKGQVASVRPVPHIVTPWTLRDAQHNSFPFVKPKGPLWNVLENPKNDALRASALDKKNSNRRKALLDLADIMSFDVEAFDDWLGKGLLERLRERRQQLLKLEGTESDVVLATINRFLLSCNLNKGNGPQQLLRQVAERLMEEFERSPQDDWIEIAVSLLIGAFDNKKKEWQCSGALLFEAHGKDLSIFDPRLVSSVSEALGQPSSEAGDKGNRPTLGICALTGIEEQLLKGNFPQPNLHVLGQTYLFAKNRDIPANDRYGQFSVDAMHVGQETVIRLSAAFEALTCDIRKNITWRAIPGESPKQSDLLLAFVEVIPDAPIVESLVEEDFSDEASEELSITQDSISAFEKRTERMINLVKATVGDDVTRTPVQLAVFRKVDPANRKVSCANTFSVADLYQAATNWATGERNIPSWVRLPVLKKGERKPQPASPPHIAPLGMIAFSKQLYNRGGTKRQEVMGLPASETLGLFLDRNKKVWQRAKRMLRLVLNRRAALLAGVAHVQHQHTPRSWERQLEIIKKFDCNEALRTITLLGVLLHKLSREKETYMNETAFKLGQLLAAADIVHAGYCADIRGGAVPPSLLGNQVFTMAQTAPAKALATLCRRWKPYDGWAKKATREPSRIQALVANSKKDEQQRGWDIKKALRYAREMGPIAAELAPLLGACRVDDVFRAELLLGYMSGLPKAQKQDNDVQDQNQGQED
ncbi:MAG: hypothetical protein HY881_10355 [Deltaproteobacteria bacterium]|nr:hypothetical protein [Deltaproteobacteria bacterium]